MTTNKGDNHQSALTGHPRHFPSRCRASLSLPPLSPFLKALPQMRAEAAGGVLSRQQEVPRQVPVTELPPRGTLKTAEKDF